jgi:cbb3-type cytochrome oxidase subunit 3
MEGDSLPENTGRKVMSFTGWAYFAFTLLLFLVFVGIVIYYFAPKRKDKVEKPKYRMFDDD